MRTNNQDSHTGPFGVQALAWSLRPGGQPRTLKRVLRTIAALCLGNALTAIVCAQANSWTNTASGKWETAGNWSAGAPTNTQSAFITNSTTKTVTIDAITSGSFSNTMTVNNLTVAAPGGSVNTLSLLNAGTNTPLNVLNSCTISNGGALTMTNARVNIAGQLKNFAALTIAGGSLNVAGDFTSSGNSNAVWVTGGQLAATSGNSFIGQVTVSNGTFLARELFIGNVAQTGVGTLTVAGGVVALPGSFNGMIVGGTGGTGTVWQTGGQIITTNTDISIGGLFSPATGRMIISNGTTRARRVFVGGQGGGDGVLAVAGGTNLISGVLNLANSAGATGAVWLTGGQLIVTNDQTFVGFNGVGQLTVSNGTWLAQHVTVGELDGARGTMTVAGGTNVLSSFFTVADNGTGAVWVTGGLLVATNNNTTIGNNGPGQVIISNGLFRARDVVVATFPTSAGTLTVAGGTFTANRLVATNSGARINFPAGTMTLRGANVTGGPGFIEIGSPGRSAVLNIVAGTNVFQGLAPGVEATATGTVWMTGGELILSNGIDVAYRGIGEVTISNGTCRSSYFTAGVDDGGVGTLRFAGGTSTVSSFIELGGAVGGTGRAWLTGGELSITNDQTTIGYLGVGQMTVSNGTWRARDVSVGRFAGSDGALTIAGGSNALSSVLSVGAQAGATGTVSLTGGQLLVTNQTTRVGDSGVGQMTVSNGTCRVFEMVVGDNPGARGTWAVAGGTNIVLDMLRVAVSGGATGTVWMTGGQLIVTNAETQVGDGGIGQLTVSNGTWLARDVVIAKVLGSQGTLTVAGGTSTVPSSLILGNLACTATGIVNVTGGSLFVTNATGTAVLDVRSGSLNISGGHVEVDTIILTNSCASFSHTGGTLVYSNAVLPTNFAADADADGINNAWEQAAGLDPLDPADAPLDDDGDGKTNLEEFNTDTDPHDPTDYLHISSVVLTNNDVLITWPVGTFFGIGIAYRVLSDTNLVTGVTNNLSPFIFGGAATVTNYLDVGGATNSPARFYRVKGLID